MQWAQRGTGQLLRPWMISGDAAEMQTSNGRESAHFVVLLCGRSGRLDGQQASAVCRSALHVGIGDAGGVREGCPPAVRTQSAPLHAVSEPCERSETAVCAGGEGAWRGDRKVGR